MTHVFFVLQQLLHLVAHANEYIRLDFWLSEKKLKEKTIFWHFLKHKACNLTSRRLGYQILNIEQKKKTQKLKNSRKKLKTQEKTQNSSQKLNKSAFFCPLHAEKMAKKQACFIQHNFQ